MSTSSFSILSKDSEEPKQELYMAASRDEISSYQEAEEFLVDPKHSKYQTLKEDTPEIQ